MGSSTDSGSSGGSKPGTTVVRRPNGTLVEVPSDQAGDLKLLGYTEETPDERTNRLAAEDTKDYWSGFGQKIVTGAEGVFSGLTAGFGDPLLEALGDEHAGERAKYNPGVRLGSEIVGAVAPALLGDEAGIGSLLAKTPSGMLARATEGMGALSRGAVEGAVYGAGGAVSRATLTGDPLTGEALVDGAGWGSVFGMGIGAVGKGLGGIATKVGNKLDERAAMEAVDSLSKEAEAAGAAATEVPKAEKVMRASDMVPSESWSALRSEVRGVAKTADEAADQIERRLKLASVDQSFMRTPTEMAPELTLGAEKLSNVGNDVTAWAMRVGGPEGKKAIGAIRKAWSAASAAAKTGDPEAFRGALNKYRVVLEDWADNLHAKVEIPAPLTLQIESAVNEGQKAFQSAAEFRTVAEGLKWMPSTANGWVAMPKGRAEQLHAALEKALKLDIPELSASKAALSEAMADVGKKLSVAGNDPIDVMRKGWAALREAQGKKVVSTIDEMIKKASKEEAAKAASSAGSRVGKAARSVLASALGYKAGKMIAKSMGLEWGSAMGYSVFKAAKGLISNPASEVLAMKSNVLGRLKNAVDGMQHVGTVMRKAGPRVAGTVAGHATKDPLRVRLDGTYDNEPGDRNKVFARRQKEIAAAAGVVHDTLFRAIQPLHMYEPDVAKSVHAAATSAFQVLYQLMPKNPGTAFSGFQTLRTPDPVAQERFSRAYEVFHGGIDWLERALSGQTAVTADHAKAFANMWPGLSAELKTHVLGYLADKGTEWLQGDTKHQQAMSQLLDIPTHSVFKPEWVAAQQAMYLQRNQPQQTNTGTPPGQSSSGGGRPPANNPDATSAQKSTER